MKLIFVRFHGLKGHNSMEFCLAVVPPELTTAEFASQWGDVSESVVYAPTRTLRPSEAIRLYDYVQDFDTVIVGPYFSTLSLHTTAY